MSPCSWSATNAYCRASYSTRAAFTSSSTVPPLALDVKLAGIAAPDEEEAVKLFCDVIVVVYLQPEAVNLVCNLGIDPVGFVSPNGEAVSDFGVGWVSRYNLEL